MTELSEKTETMRNCRGDRRGLHPNSLKNLHHPGKGRPRKEFSLTSLTREMIPQVCPYDPKGRTWGEYLVDRWLSLAAENPAYFRELIERLEGKIPQPGSPLIEVDRTVNIIVRDQETRDLIARVGDRTKELLPLQGG